MGSSKIAMLSGIYLIIGMYTLQFQSAENQSTEPVITAAGETKQAEKLARAGIIMAVSKMGSNESMFSFSGESSTSREGKIIYSACRPAGLPSSQSKITAFGICQSDTVNLTAIVCYDHGRWKVLHL